ncbi:MAG: methyltransferase domain-containing protein [Luteitalea sp.]|nr:methyltransferase domain-containing protein [Luteitalea sp.]
MTSSTQHERGQRASGRPSRVGTAADRVFLSLLRRYIQDAQVSLALGDLVYGPTSGEPVGTIQIRNRATLMRLLARPTLEFGEAYMKGDLEVAGDLVAALEALYRTTSDVARGWWHRLALWLDRSHSLNAARHNIHHHYDIGNDFYRLWLDEHLVYTCAYFAHDRASLEEAQRAKLEYVCRKLRLQPGERVVEAGCGWGALALHMAREHGVRVRAFNISHEQIAYAREQARAEGLADRVEFIEDDYRHITGRYDAFVSVGMLEHVGLECYDALGRVIDRVLDPNGRGFLHFIGRNRPAPLNAWIRKRIFPGGYPPTLPQVVGLILAPFDLSVVDIENLRLHYARTLHHWRSRFEAATDCVRTMFDEPFARAWLLYLAGSEAAFTTGTMQLFQVLFARGATNRVPISRKDLYVRPL